MSTDMCRCNQQDGESPVKCGGKGASDRRRILKSLPEGDRGIAGYTLIYNSYGLLLSSHEPFLSAEAAVQEENDIVSRRVAGAPDTAQAPGGGYR